jgi:GNAT superfamily N-acetyltransferase
MTIEVRRAVPADAHGIAEVHVQSWRETYSHLVPADSLALLKVKRYELRWAELITAQSPDVWVAAVGEDVIGWASSSVGHDSEAPRDLQLEGIYLLASHHGSGAGQLLLDAAVRDAPAYLWVAEENPRAWAFYVRNGFVPDGAVETHSLAGTPVAASRLVR